MKRFAQDEDLELWDIKDKAPVVRPDDGDNAGPTDPITDRDLDNYLEALREMPIHLQLRWARCRQSIDVLVAILRHSYVTGFYKKERQ